MTPARLLTVLALATSAACARAPDIDGAPCPCPAGYFCDPARGVCVDESLLPPTMTPVRPPGNSYPPPSNPTNPPVSSPLQCPDIGAGPPRPLGVAEYRYSLLDLVGLDVAAELPEAYLGGSGFSNSAERTSVTEQLRALAPMVASRLLMAGRLPELLGCDPALATEDICASGFIERFGRRVYRRPLLEVERGALKQTYNGARQKQVFSVAIARVIEELLAADQFLVRREEGGTRRPALGRVALTGFEVATRLSYLLWASTPDDVLLAAAEDRLLDTAEGVRAQAERLLADGRSERTYLEFFRDWLEIDGDTLAAAGTTFTAFGSELRAAVVESADALVLQVIRAQDADLATWLTWPLLYGNRAMADFYGLDRTSQVGDGFAWSSPLGEQRRYGALTAPARLAHSGPTKDSRPVTRGLWINERLRCFDGIPPPPSVPAPPPMREDQSTKQRLDQHRSEAACAACHRYIDPLGFGLDNYDGVGRWRTHEDSYDIDPSGAVDDLVFSGPGELAAGLAASPEVRRCMVKQWFRYGFGRREQDQDACTLSIMDKAFAAGNYRTRAALLAVVTSEAFTTLPAPAK